MSTANNPNNPNNPMEALSQALQQVEDAQQAATQAAAAKAAKKGDGLRKATNKSARTRAREFAVQALYQHLVGADDAAGIDAFTRELSGFHKSDSAHFDALLHGCIEESADLDALIAPHLDRPLGEISPIERAVMWIGAYEMLHCLDVPWRVVINESVELAKSFGGTDGHKFVNGVMNTIAPKLRQAEVEADRHRRA